jgi:cytoskeletal protein CcmA (bactofilin family)
MRAIPRTRPRGSCRGSVFLLAMVALVTLLLLGACLVSNAVQGLARSSDDQRRTEAFCLAESGVEMALAKLYEDYDDINNTLATAGQYDDSFTLPQGSVAYTVTAPVSGVADSCLIVSQATTWTNRQARVRVIATYLRDVGRVFDGAIFCDSPLTLHGAGGVYPDADGKGGAIYANGDVTFDGESFTMTEEGAIYTTGNVNWVPPDVPATSVHQGVAPISMPVIDLDYYESIATTKYTGRTTFSTDDLQDLSGIIFVKGDVNISGSYTGNAMIVATGKISVTGNVTTEHLDTDALALLSPKSIKIAGNSTVHGLVYSHSIVDDGETTVGGNITIYGALCADVVRSNGSIEVHYRDVWSSLPLPGTGKTQWAPISWQELYL